MAHVPQSRLDSHLDRLLAGREFVGGILAVIDDMIEIISENNRVRNATRKGVVPLDFETLLSRLAETDESLAEALQSAQVDRFTQGHLSLTVANNPFSGLAMFGHDRLRAACESVYGVPFKVRIKRT